MEISQWILSISGVALISMLSDLILPDGEMNKYIKSILSLFIVFIIAFPLPKILNSDIDFYTILQEDQEVYLDIDYIEYINESRTTSLEAICVQQFEFNDIKNCQIKIISEYKEKYTIKSIIVNMKNVVIENQEMNIDMVRTISKIIMNVCNVSEGVIKFEY